MNKRTQKAKSRKKRHKLRGGTNQMKVHAADPSVSSQYKSYPVLEATYVRTLNPEGSVQKSNIYNSCDIKKGTLIQSKDENNKLGYVLSFNGTQINTVYSNDTKFTIEQQAVIPYLYNDILVNIDKILNIVIRKPFLNASPDNNTNMKNIDNIILLKNKMNEINELCDKFNEYYPI